jgi:hypothetical protein
MAFAVTFALSGLAPALAYDLGHPVVRLLTVMLGLVAVQAAWWAVRRVRKSPRSK